MRGIEHFGWRRVDPRPWRKLNARWEHRAGWLLEHCHHPTALWPWALYDPAGRMHRTGGMYGHNPITHGTAWPNLETAAQYVHRLLARSGSDVSAPPRKPKRGTCQCCGCTDNRACVWGCWWANPQHTLCSSCVGLKAVLEEARG